MGLIKVNEIKDEVDLGNLMLPICYGKTTISLIDRYEYITSYAATIYLMKKDFSSGSRILLTLAVLKDLDLLQQINNEYYYMYTGDTSRRMYYLAKMHIPLTGHYFDIDDNLCTYSMSANNNFIPRPIYTWASRPGGGVTDYEDSFMSSMKGVVTLGEPFELH
jgi:hypothetical protein